MTQVADPYELELRAFVENLNDHTPDLVDRKIWLHSRWYEDDHYHRILDAAKEVDSRMSFCFLGRDVHHRKAVIQRMLEDGHEVGTHGRLHYRIDEHFGYDEMHAELAPCVAELQALGVDCHGLYIGVQGQLSDGAARALADLGLRWFAAGRAQDAANLPEELTYVPVRRPHDVELLFYQDGVSPEQALAHWRSMASEEPAEAAFFFHPFTLTMLETNYLDAWKEFLSSIGGSVPASEKTMGGSSRHAIVFDASLHLAPAR